MKPPPREKPIHQRAFEYFYELGEKRTIQKVSEKFAKSRVAVQIWSKRFSWWDRVVKRDKAVSDSILDNMDAYKKKSKEETLKLIRATKIRYASLLKNQKITASDFERICRLEQLLIGEPDSRVEEGTLAAIVKRASQDFRED